MTKNNPQNNNANLNALKYLASTITFEAHNPLSSIKATCQNIKDNLEQTIELIDSIYDSSARSLVAIDIALRNVNVGKIEGEIDRSGFVELSIVEVVENAIAKYFFNGKEEIDLLNVDLSDDFVFLGDENLMSFVVLNLLKHCLVYQTKINIWFSARERCFYFKVGRGAVFKDGLDNIFNERKVGFTKPDQQAKLGQHRIDSQNPNGNEAGRVNEVWLEFCQKVMRAFGGDILVKSGRGKGTEFCLKF